MKRLIGILAISAMCFGTGCGSDNRRDDMYTDSLSDTGYNYSDTLDTMGQDTLYHNNSSTSDRTNTNDRVNNQHRNTDIGNNSNKQE